MSPSNELSLPSAASLSDRLSRDKQPPLSRDEVQLLKDTVCRGATDLELKLFVEVCNSKRLNPFSKQIHPVKRWDKDLKREVMSFQTGIDGFRLIAQRSGLYEGQDGPYWCGPDGKWLDVWLDRKPPMAAKVGVYRRGFQKPLYAVALYTEYVQLTKEGNVNSMWARMPAGQTSKCAEALALRKAFPEELSGLCTSDEMGQADNPPEAPEPPSALRRNADPIPEVTTVPEEVQMMWSNFGNIKGVCDVFAKLKQWLKEALGDEAGEAEYYRVLAEHGVAHANQLKNRGAAKKASWQLWELLQKAEMLAAEEPPKIDAE